MKKIKVLIVDDSPIVRKVFTEELSGDAQIEVIGAAADPFIARDMIVYRQPDVITLDIEMPRMDGITFLRKLMHHYPLPVIIISSLVPEGGELALEALDAGAVEVMCKPKAGGWIGDMSVQLIDKIKAAALVDVAHRKSNSPTIPPSSKKLSFRTETDKIVAVGASTGGVQALQELLTPLPSNAPGILIVQHMPEHFTKSFAGRLNKLCEMEVKEAEDGDRLSVGKVLIAPGNRHLILKQAKPDYVVQVKDGPLVCRHRPSVDVLFQSVANHVGEKTIGILLTGMGRDGSKGMQFLKQKGAITIAEDESSCVVFGMPREAIKLNVVDYVLPVKRIPEKILYLAAQS